MAVAAISFAGIQSCSKNDNNDYDLYFPDALVTVKPVSDTEFYLQVDDKTALLPVCTTKLPFGKKEVRALVNYTETEMPEGSDKEKFAGAVKINWIDSLLTKQSKPDMGEDNDKTYGNDPVEIELNNWMTVVEDGYITLAFATIWGNSNIKHEVNLITGGNPENPYEVEFRHNAHGDTCGTAGNGLVAFRLNNLPDTEGETVKLKLKWNSFRGPKSVEFDYCTRKDE